MKILLISILFCNLVTAKTFGENCLMENKDRQIDTILEAKAKLKNKIEELQVNWRAISVKKANVGSSVDCPALEVIVFRQSEIETLRSLHGDFYDGFPVIYKTGSRITKP